MSRLTDAPTLISPRNPEKGLSERFHEHRQAIKAARKGSEVHVKREGGALVVGYGRSRG
jgi:hypothetical protein